MKWALYLFFLWITPVWAMYCGNPAAPDLPSDGAKGTREAPLQLRIGYQGDFLLDTPLHDNGECKGNFQMLTIGGVIQRRISVEFMMGTAALNFLKNQAGQQLIVYSSGFPAYGLRVQGVIKKWKDLFLGASAGGILAFPKVRGQTIQGAATESHPHLLNVRTWQTGLTFGKKGELLSPYLGAKIGDLRAKGGKRKFSAQKKMGVVLGCNLSPYAILAVNFEARIIDEESCTIEGYVAF